jgi:hypothetical protein
VNRSATSARFSARAAEWRETGRRQNFQDGIGLDMLTQRLVAKLDRLAVDRELVNLVAKQRLQDGC